MAPAVCLDPAKAQKNLIRTPNLLRNHEQRRASADKLCLGGYPASHTRLVQRILNGTLPFLRLKQDRAAAAKCLARHILSALTVVFMSGIIVPYENIVDRVS